MSTAPPPPPPGLSNVAESGFWLLLQSFCFRITAASTRNLASYVQVKNVSRVAVHWGAGGGTKERFLIGTLAFFQEFFGGGESILIQIFIVMLIFLLLSDQISGEAKVSEGSKLLHAVEEPGPNCWWHLHPEATIS